MKAKRTLDHLYIARLPNHNAMYQQPPKPQNYFKDILPIKA